jgi:Fic family protein
MKMEAHIHNSNLIENIDNPREDEQSLEAWKYIIGQKELAYDTICKLQRIIVQNQNDLEPSQKGYTRSMTKINVFVGNNVPPVWRLVDDMLRNWVLDMKEHRGKLSPKEMHIRFEHVHPFCDGNGRTGRMLMWWHEIQLGQVPTLIKIEERQKYYSWFK